MQRLLLTAGLRQQLRHCHQCQEILINSASYLSWPPSARDAQQPNRAPGGFQRRWASSSSSSSPTTTRPSRKRKAAKPSTVDDLDDDDSVSSSPRRNAAADEGERQNEVEEHDQGPITVDADYDGDGDGDGDLIVASHSERVKSGSNGDTRPELVVHRPALSTFRKPGFPKDLLRWLKEFPHALLLVRVGQFYESYFDQAVEIADLLKIRLTSKSMESKRYPMCGFPIAHMDKFLEKLVREHNRFVAICEETKHYDKSGNLQRISRKVTRVVTPGTLIDEAFIEKQSHNYLLAIDGPSIGNSRAAAANQSGLELAWIDTSTGELFTQGSSATGRSLAEDLARIAPAEIVLPSSMSSMMEDTRDSSLRSLYSKHPIYMAIAELEPQPKVSFPVRHGKPPISAVEQETDSQRVPEEIEEEDVEGTLTQSSQSDQPFSAIPLLSAYINETLLEHQPDLSHPLRVRPANTMRIDKVSLRALEIKQNNDGGRSGTLLSVLDRTVTAAGLRLLTDRLTSPSKSLNEIKSRLSMVAFFKDNAFLRDEIVARLHQLDDEARLLQKMSIGRPTAEDLLSMAKAIRIQTDIKRVLGSGIEEVRRRTIPSHQTVDPHASASPSGQSVEQAEPEDAAVAFRIMEDMTIHDDLADKIEAAVDIRAMESQKMREALGDDPSSASTSTQAVPESVDDTEEEGVDVWNIPLDIVKGERKAKITKTKSKPSPVTEDIPEIIPEPIATKNGKALPTAITWGKQEASVLHPESSPIMSKIYEAIRRVEARARRLHRDLEKQMQAPPGEVLLRVMPRFGPILRVGWRRTHPQAMKDTLSSMDDKGAITLVRKAAAARYFSLNNWTKLNSEMQGLLVQLREAENFAVRELCDGVLTQWDTLRRNAAITAELDVATSLAKAAQELDLTRPELDEGNTLEITDGRHPVAEYELAKQGRGFISNSTTIDEQSRLQIITGPNMGGKSTVLRQVGIIAAMAQAGSFVPASRAKIGIVDQLFARIRYSDNIARGRSSFRVEMDDAAYILEHATDRSLVLLDEFGRGTTADYAACIAESTIYALANVINARSLFATHLHDIYDILNRKLQGNNELLLNRNTTEEEEEEQCGRGNQDPRDKVVFLCTQLEETQAPPPTSETTGRDSMRTQKDSDEPEQEEEQGATVTRPSLQYLYKLVPGVNRDAAAFKVAQLAGYPDYLLERAQRIFDVRSAQNEQQQKK